MICEAPVWPEQLPAAPEAEQVSTRRVLVNIATGRLSQGRRQDYAADLHRIGFVDRPARRDGLDDAYVHPTRASLNSSGAVVRNDPQHPSERLATALAHCVANGELHAGVLAAKAADLAAEHGVSLATAACGVALAKDWGRPRCRQRRLLDADLANAESKTLRYRLLHVAARLTRGQRRCWLRIKRTWP